MTILVALALLVQAPLWIASPATVTVGDTVRLTRRVAAGPEVIAAALPLESTDVYSLLSEPVAAYSEGAVVVRYHLAFFETGSFPLAMPDLELSFPDGRVNVVTGDTAWVSVVSVLPAEDSIPAPMPSLGPIPREQRSIAPVILMVAVTVCCLLLWAVRRRRISPRPVWSGATKQKPDLPLQQWIMAGELKAVVGAINDRLRDAIESALPEAGRQLSTLQCIEVIGATGVDWPLRDIDDVLRSLERAQYAPAVPSDIALLADQVEALISTICEQKGEE